MPKPDSNPSPKLYPWQADDWQKFEQFGQRIPHALLISGVPGVGKLTLALAMAQALLCEIHSACGVCRQCQFFASGNHPDLHLVLTEELALQQPEQWLPYANRYLEDLAKIGKRKPRRIISIDQIRQLIANAGLAQHSAERKVVVLAPAESMNINAANALLKLLEEPPSNTVLLLVTHAPAQLPVTVRSRCVPMIADVPESGQALAWLASMQTEASQEMLVKALSLSAGAPLRALTALQSGEINSFADVLSVLQAMVMGQQDAISASDALFKLLDGRRLLDGLQSLIHEVLLARVTGGDAADAGPYLTGHPDLNLALKQVPEPALAGFYDELAQYKSHAFEQLNQQLLFEQISLKFLVLCRRRAAAA